MEAGQYCSSNISAFAEAQHTKKTWPVLILYRLAIGADTRANRADGLDFLTLWPLHIAQLSVLIELKRNKETHSFHFYRNFSRGAC